MVTTLKVSTTPVTTPVSEQVRELINVLEGEMSRTELMNKMVLKHRSHFTEMYLQHALDVELIELTQPETPNSPTQKYRLTNKGKALKKQ